VFCIQTRAAISAGYSPKSAAAAGSRLLTNADIKAAIDAELLRQAEMSGINGTYVLEGIRAIADDLSCRCPGSGEQKPRGGDSFCFLCASRM